MFMNNGKIQRFLSNNRLLLLYCTWSDAASSQAWSLSPKAGKNSDRERGGSGNNAS